MPLRLWLLLVALPLSACGSQQVPPLIFSNPFGLSGASLPLSLQGGGAGGSLSMSFQPLGPGVLPFAPTAYTVTIEIQGASWPQGPSTFTLSGIQATLTLSDQSGALPPISLSGGPWTFQQTSSGYSVQGATLTGTVNSEDLQALTLLLTSGTQDQATLALKANLAPASSGTLQLVFGPGQEEFSFFNAP